MMSDELTCTMSKIVQSLKRGEVSKVEIKNTFVANEDSTLLKMLQDSEAAYDESKPLFAYVKLLRLAKLEDWFKDGTTIVRTLRKGKGRNPYTDSTVKLRLEV